MRLEAGRGEPRNRLPKTALNSCPRSLLGLKFLDPAVTALLELVSEFAAAGAYDAAAGQYMHEIRHDVVEQALIVSNDDQTTFGRAQTVDTVGHNAQRVDIKARVGFIEHRQFRLEQRHLQHFVA